MGSLAQVSSPTLPPLDPEHGGSHLPGKFVWADLVTDNPAAAKRFYAGLFGWSFRGDDKYLVATCDGVSLAGIVYRQRPALRPEAKPRWLPYMSVDDVDIALRHANQSGGRTLAAPREFPGRGRQAALADPEGALFGLIRSSSGDPADARAVTGGWIWLQLLSRDAAKAAKFYQKIGGYEAHRNTAGNRSSDFILSSKGIARGTIRTIPSGKSDVLPVWLPFVCVDDVARSQSKAERLGGKVLVAARADLMDGRVAVVADPTGAAVGIMQWRP